MSDPSQPSNDPGLGAGGGSGGGNAQNGGGPGSSSGADNKNSGTNSSSNNNNNNSNGNNNNNNNNAVGVERFITYEDYLDSQITAEDRKFLSDDELARSLVEIGCRKGEVLSREEFSTRRDAAEALKKSKLQNAPKILSSAQKDLTNYPFLRHLAAREELVRHGKLSVIIFIRDRNSKGQEVSGYIDYAHRLRTENFEPYFLRKKKLLPTTRDLSYMNWDTSQCTQNESPEFHILPDFESGLLFKNKKDRKIICVDPRSKEAGDNSKRHEIQTNEYIQVVLFDHMTRKKS